MTQTTFAIDAAINDKETTVTETKTATKPATTRRSTARKPAEKKETTVTKPETPKPTTRKRTVRKPASKFSIALPADPKKYAYPDKLPALLEELTKLNELANSCFAKLPKGFKADELPKNPTKTPSKGNPKCVPLKETDEAAPQLEMLTIIAAANGWRDLWATGAQLEDCGAAITKKEVTNAKGKVVKHNDPEKDGAVYVYYTTHNADGLIVVHPYWLYNVDAVKWPKGMPDDLAAVRKAVAKDSSNVKRGRNITTAAENEKLKDQLAELQAKYDSTNDKLDKLAGMFEQFMTVMVSK